MLSVSMVDGWLAGQRAARPPRPGGHGQRGRHDGVIIRTGGRGLPERLAGQPGDQARDHRAGDEDCGRSGRDLRPGGSGPSAGPQALRLHLIVMPAGTRGEPQLTVNRGGVTAIAVAAAPGEPSGAPRPLYAGARRARRGHGGLLLRRTSPGASLPPRAGFAVSGPGSPLV